MTDDDKRAYWRANLRLMIALLTVWFVVSFGLGILLVDAFDSVMIGPLKMTFWFAQQGSIYTFVILVGIYAWRMDALDARFGLRGGDAADQADSGDEGAH